MSDQLYRVAARSRTGGWEGKGKPLTRDLAQSDAAYGNEAYPHVEHWIEPVEAESDLEEARR
jgi:hypothetical protein